MVEDTPDTKDRCATCNHTYSFHGQGGSCRVIGCNKGPHGWTCPKFVPLPSKD